MKITRLPGWGAMACLILAEACLGEQETIILDESAYCKAYYQYGWERLSARALKEDGRKLFGKRELAKLAWEVKQRLAHLKIDWTREDWRDRAVYRGFRMGGTRDIAKLRAAYTDPPPAAWTGANFDDSLWLRFRRPFAVGEATGVHFGQWRCQGPGLQAALFRYRFVLADPAKADLTLEASYYGGARVFVNGTEVARGHLRAGDLAPDAVAEDYPLGAYRRLFSELSEKEKQRAKRKGLYTGDPPKYFGNVGHLVAPGSRVHKLRSRSLPAVKVPPGLLRKGTNVLAVEVRAAPLHPAAANQEWLGTGGEHSSAWLHARLTRLSLRAAAGAAVSALKRPTGVQVWAEDMNRRLFSPEFLEPGAERGTIRIVGGPNGTYAAQVVVGTDRELTGVRIVPGDLRSPGGGVIPAGAVKACGMVGHPIGGMVDQLGQGRIPVFRCAVTGREPPPVKQALLRFAPPLTDRKARARAEASILYFDHITPDLPEKVPADTCRPYWLSLKMPPRAAAGTYRGSVRVEMPPAPTVQVPMTVEVVPWRVPDPADFQVNMAIEQSPYGVARQYPSGPDKDARSGSKPLGLWSDRHFELIEASLKQLGRVGNDWWFVPVLLRTEFGNMDDSMIRWYRLPDGSLAFDYSILDRYLELIVKHCGRPKVVSFVVMHGAPSPIEVMVFNATTGKPERVHLGGAAAEDAVRRTYWAAFANDLYRHMKSLHLADAMHWGYAWDTEGDPRLKPLLASVVPLVRWTSGSHNTKRGGSGGGGRLDTNYYRSTSEIYSLPLGAHSRMGWKNPEIRLNTPRAESTCGCIEGHTMPFGYRLIVDRAVVSGFNGLGRIGGDYWAGAYWRGMRGSLWHMAGFPILTVLWPGRRGAECSVRFEAFIEGLQEAEARVFIEQALDRKLLPEPLAKRAADVLFHHNRQTLSIPTHVPANLMAENAQGWLERSRRLYAAAAEVAAVVGLDVARTHVVSAVAPFGRPAVNVRIRNWTARPRKWAAASPQDWIVPERAAGTATGFESLLVRLDGERLKPGAQAVGALTVTDLSAGREHAVTITAKVHQVFDFPDRIVMNVAPGRPATRRGVALFNSAAVELPFRVTPAAEWVKPDPAAGKIAPGRIEFLNLLVRAPDRPGMHQTSLNVRVGDAERQSKLTVYVIPPYEPPTEPAGEPVWLLDALRSKKISTTSHTAFGLRWDEIRKLPPAKQPHVSWYMKGPMYSGHNIPGGAREHMVYDRDRNLVPYAMGGRTFQRGYWAFPSARTAYAIEGSGFAAFSAWVGFSRGMETGAGLANRGAVCNCEIYVDGRLRAQSGLFKVGDRPRLLAVEHLAGAKRITLVTRTAGGDTDRRVVVAWGDPKFYK